MKIKYALLALCLALLMLLFAGCKKEDSGNTDNTGGNTDNTGDNSGDSGDNGGGQNQECTHSFTDGVCVHCGENDPNYKPGGSDNTDDNKGDEQKPDEEPEVPPIDMGGETELPFVPAK